MSKKMESEETVRNLHSEKSNLLMEAQRLIGIGNPEEAIERFALAALLEAHLARHYTRIGEKDMAARHWFSAAICYAKSGSLREALKVFNALGCDKDTPGQYKGEGLLWAARLRQQQRETLQAYGHSVQSAA